MLYQIADGSVSPGGTAVLSHFDFMIKGTEKIAVVGRNGAGKSTLLRLIAGELSLDRDDKRNGPGITTARRLTVGMLGQQAFGDGEQTVEEELLSGCPCRDLFDRERFAYEMEYDRMFTGLGFSRADKKKKLREFSGGEQTKIGLIRLLLDRPDILLLDEPTNHLDLASVQWLEEELRTYERAVVMVSHDRFFLDRVAEVIYEIDRGRLTRYAGNYTAYRAEKAKRLELQQKAYERQQEEIRRLEEVIQRFKHKPTKASFARAKRRQLERMPLAEKPEEEAARFFPGEISPLHPGSKWTLEAEHLKIGYDRPLLEVSLRVRRGQKIGILGANGAGKSTFLKTVSGFLEPLDGTYTLGNHVTLGYFDQHSAKIQSGKTVLEHFHELYPSLTEKEVRSVLGAYRFGGRDAAKTVSSLSGGEKARLVLAELLQSRPSLLILDEPTNHMDILAKETLEAAFQAYTGTILFVSHDRYFIRQVADAILIFEEDGVMYYPFGYEHYLERIRRGADGGGAAARVKAEDAALLAGMRAVPKAERHRLREIPEEEAYLEWKLRLASERMEPAGSRLERLEEACRELETAIAQSPETWAAVFPELWEQDGTSGSDKTAALEKKPEQGGAPARLEALMQEREALSRERDAAWEQWHEACLAWLEAWEE